MRKTKWFNFILGLIVGMLIVSFIWGITFYFSAKKKFSIQTSYSFRIPREPIKTPTSIEELSKKEIVYSKGFG